MPHTVPVWPLSTPANARAHDDPLADRERHVRPELRALGKLAGDDVRLRTMDGVHFANGIGRIESCRRPREGDALLDFLHDVQRVAGSDRLELVVVHKPCLGAIKRRKLLQVSIASSASSRLGGASVPRLAPSARA